VSLLRGGLGERIERRRLGGDVNPSVWIRRVVIGSLVAAMAFAASGLSGIAAGDVERVEGLGLQFADRVRVAWSHGCGCGRAWRGWFSSI
jgi:hypothetical protein